MLIREMDRREIPMFATTNTTEATALRSLTTNEIEAVAGGYIMNGSVLIGDRAEVGCGTMILLRRIVERMTGKL
jgi:hypothetical protein